MGEETTGERFRRRGFEGSLLTVGSALSVHLVRFGTNLVLTRLLLRESFGLMALVNVFVLGLDGGGDVSLPSLELADRPVVIVVGSEGKGLSRLVTETCDQIVSIPISSATESLNAGIAASVALYQIATMRAGRDA